MEMHPIPIELFRLKSTTTDEFVAALPGGTAIMSGSFTSGTIEFDADITVTGTSALNGLVTLGIDAATNTAGSIKFWSAGANNFYTTFTAGTQTANATYTLPTAMPAVNSLPLICSTAGVMAWSGNFGLNQINAGTLVVDNITIDGLDITSSGTLNITATSNIYIDSSGGQIFLQSFTYANNDILFPDNIVAYFGTGGDATIYYDATNLRINPKAVGSGACIVDGDLFVRNNTADTHFTNYSVEINREVTSTVQFQTPLVTSCDILLTANLATTGYFNGANTVVRYGSNYNLTTTHTDGVSLAGFVNVTNFAALAASGDVDCVACGFLRFNENSTNYTGTIGTLYGIRLSKIGTAASAVDVTNIHGFSIAEIDGHSNAATCVGLYIGNVHDAATNYAIETNGGIHLLRDAIYFTQTDGAEKIDSDADGTLDLYAGTSINAHGNVFPATDNTYYLGKNDDDTPLAWKGLILKDQAGTGKYYRVEVVDNALTITDLTD